MAARWYVALRSYWVDRAPVLISFLRVATLLGGLVPLRLIGCLATVLVVLGAAHVARRIGGPGAALRAALTTAAWVSGSSCSCVRSRTDSVAPTGFGWVLAGVHDAIVQMDADLSHPPERLPALIAALEDADVAIGSRHVRGGVRNWKLSRQAISRGGNLYVRLVLGMPFHDTTAGFKAIRRDALERIGARNTESNGYYFQIENTRRASRLGLRITGVPITFQDRTQGEAKMSVDIVREAMLRVLTRRWREIHDHHLDRHPEHHDAPV